MLSDRAQNYINDVPAKTDALNGSDATVAKICRLDDPATEEVRAELDAQGVLTKDYDGWLCLAKPTLLAGGGMAKEGLGVAQPGDGGTDAAPDPVETVFLPDTTPVLDINDVPGSLRQIAERMGWKVKE